MEATLGRPTKPLGRKGYGHIPHLPGSRLGPGDHRCHEGQARICLEKARDRHDRIIVSVKYDGSNVSVARVGDQILALQRKGYLAQSSPYRQHQLFADWVRRQEDRFRAVVQDGQRVVGEWLAQAHGTRYRLPYEPWVVFDALTDDGERLPYDTIVRDICLPGRFLQARVLHDGGPCSIERALGLLNTAYQEEREPVPLDAPEGIVYRVERRGKPDFLAKYVRSDKVDGLYLPEISGQADVWNWQPSRAASVAAPQEAG